jgi:predicted 3-demethylubiquinone-9 3-methyltransferase (glyoxalase superfamily)
MGALESYPRITPFLWFDSNAEEAVELYLSIFKNSRRLDTLIANEDGPVRKGKTLTIAFELDGQKFSALNGGPLFHFTEAISFVVRLRHAGGSGRVLAKLSDGGSEGQCCWLKDKFGLSWQIVPAELPQLIKHPKAFQAMLQMRKPDLAQLRKAASEESYSNGPCHGINNGTESRRR